MQLLKWISVIVSFCVVTQTAFAGCCASATCTSIYNESDCKSAKYNAGQPGTDVPCSAFYCAWQVNADNVNGGVCTPGKEPASC